MVDIIHRIGIRAPLGKVYDAFATVKGLAGWWTEETTGDARVGGRISFTFRSPTGDLMATMVMQVQALTAPREARWRCVEGPPEWLGTDITFELSEQDGQAILLFGHRNWREAVEFTAHCSTKWAVFLLSLRELVEQGTGRPSPRDLKIDNWN
jgi:uncharacterized protein YndB with AHSA1/START domain